MAKIQTGSSSDRIIASAQDIATRVAGPLAMTVDKDAIWPADSLCALGDAGRLGLYVPRCLGGLGEGRSSLARVTEVLGHACSSTAMCFGMHCVAGFKGRQP